MFTIYISFSLVFFSNKLSKPYQEIDFIIFIFEKALFSYFFSSFFVVKNSSMYIELIMCVYLMC